MNQLLAITDDPGLAEQWQQLFASDELDVKSLATTDDIISACQSSSLLLYHLPNNNDAAKTLLHCLENKPVSLPVILVSNEPGTRLFQEYENHDVKDTVLPENTVRLELIVRRELKHVNQLAQFKSLEQHQDALSDPIDVNEEAIAFIQDGMHMHVNPAYAGIFGYSQDDLASKPVMDLISPKYQEDFRKQIQHMPNLSASKQIEVDCKRMDETTFRGLFTFSPATYEEETCIQLQVDNIEFEHKARLLSDQDPDTGLGSRHTFMQHLQTLFSRKDPDAKHVSVIYILVDQFDKLKQTHGLIDSDLILNEMSQILRSQMNASMNPYRYGDHAFTIIIESDNPQLARVVAETLIRLISQHNYQSVSNVVSPTVSIGISRNKNLDSDNAEREANLLLENAYQACLVIYENAGHGYMDFDNLQQIKHQQNDIERIDDNSHIKDMISYALNHDHFRLLFQPVISTQGHTGEFYAVLLRLLDNDNQEIRPQYFVRQAMSFGMMRDIDHWVIKNAIETLAIRRRETNRTSFFIQLSPSSIDDDTLLLWIVDCLRDNNAKGSWITFQFNYQDIKKHMMAAEKLFQGLKKINCGIAISQFENTSTGQQILNKLPIDYLKFNGDLLLENDAIALPASLTASAKVLTIAHNIENANTLTTVWQQGIHFVQGTYLQEPVSNITLN